MFDHPLSRDVARTIVSLAIFVAASRVGNAQTAANVAVVINTNSAESQRIGDYYAHVHGLSESNVIRIQTSTDDAIERGAYVKTIEQPIGLTIKRAGLEDRLLYLVLTKGVPLRIAGTTGSAGTTASVDSELTLLYRRLAGQPVPLEGPIDNPYYLGSRNLAEARPFSHREHDIYLVTRIDAFTVEQALALIDRAQMPSTEGRVVLDQKGTTEAGDQWLSQVASRLEEQGQRSRVVLESTPKAARGEKAVLGYSSWGASDPENRVRSVGMEFVAGSIAANLASFDARTFRQPPESWRPTASSDRTAWFEGSGDALVGDLIREGVTGVSGQVGEAYLRGAFRPEILFPAYLSGFNLAEAFYMSLPTLSWQAVVVGDPLCAPFKRQRLTVEDLKGPPDAATGLPGLFAKRRLDALHANNRDVPDSALPLLAKFQTLLEREDRVGAKRALEDAVGLAPASVSLLITLAQLEEQGGEYDVAIARYRHIIDLDPANVVALNNLAFALAVRQNAATEALPLARRAAVLAPQSGVVLDTVAWIEHLLGNDKAAAPLLAQAAGLESGLANIRLHAAIVYAALGNEAGGTVELEEALRLDPGLEASSEVRQLRARLAAPKPVIRP